MIRLRLTNSDLTRQERLRTDFDQTFALRQREADEFYATLIPPDISADAKNVMRQGFAGMLWSKQFYHYVVERLAEGRSRQSSPASGAHATGATTSGRTSTTPT